jgi:iron complex transport system substrate-binding protein
MDMAFGQTASVPAPQRIVSINLCTDQILLDLVPRERIQALSHLAGDASVSARHERAAGLRSTRGEAEDVLGFDPDLVIAGAFSTPATTALLERLGRRVLKVEAAQDIEGINAVVRRIADAVGEPQRGEALVGAFEQWLAEATRGADPGPDGRRITALIYQVNGIASGGGLAGVMLERAGLVNHAVRLGLGAGGSLPLERLAASPPDLIVLSGPIDEYRTVAADNLRHPVLAALMAKHATVVVPWRFWLCGTPYVVEAIRRLSDARRDVLARAGRR